MEGRGGLRRHQEGVDAVGEGVATAKTLALGRRRRHDDRPAWGGDGDGDAGVGEGTPERGRRSLRLGGDGDGTPASSKPKLPTSGMMAQRAATFCMAVVAKFGAVPKKR